MTDWWPWFSLTFEGSRWKKHGKMSHQGVIQMMRFGVTLLLAESGSLVGNHFLSVYFCTFSESLKFDLRFGRLVYVYPLIGCCD